MKINLDCGACSGTGLNFNKACEQCHGKKVVSVYVESGRAMTIPDNLTVPTDYTPQQEIESLRSALIGVCDTVLSTYDMRAAILHIRKRANNISVPFVY